MMQLAGTGRTAHKYEGRFSGDDQVYPRVDAGEYTRFGKSTVATAPGRGPATVTRRKLKLSTLLDSRQTDA
jgi:hypothetical protein